MIERTTLQPEKSPTRPTLPPLSLADRGRLPWEAVKLLILTLGVGLLTFVFYLYVLPNSQMSEAEARIVLLKSRVEALDRTNSELERQILVYSSMADLESRARKLGMGPPRAYRYLSSGNQLQASSVWPKGPTTQSEVQPEASEAPAQAVQDMQAPPWQSILEAVQIWALDFTSQVRERWSQITGSF